MVMTLYEGIVLQSWYVVDETDGWKIGGTIISAYHEGRIERYNCRKECNAI